MQFNLTFNKPTVAQYFDEKTAGIRVRVVNGQAMFKPVNREYGSDVFSITSRKRGGAATTITGELADLIINHTPLKEGMQLTLEKQPYGWLQATPYTGAKEDLSRFVPVARIWRVTDEIVSKSASAPVPQKRGPGRPRKNQTVQPTQMARPVPATTHFVQKPATVESATETIMMMPVNPEDYKGPVPVPVVVQNQAPITQKRGPGRPRKNLPVVFVAVPQQVVPEQEAPQVEAPKGEPIQQESQVETPVAEGQTPEPAKVEMVQVPMVPVQTEAVLSQPTEAEKVEQPTEPVKRGPGRPRKDQTMTVTEGAKRVGRPSKKSTMIPIQGAMKRGPGRPRKEEVPAL